MTASQTISQFVSRKFKLKRCMENNGMTILPQVLAAAIFQNLPSQFASRVASLETAHFQSSKQTIIQAIEGAALAVGYDEHNAAKPRVAAVNGGRGNNNSRSGGEEGRTGVLLAATSVVKKAILPMPAQHEWR
jgi:hypothetical protein